MPGTVTRILAAPGAEVARGTPHPGARSHEDGAHPAAPADGRLEALKCAVGDVVAEGAELADFAPRRGGRTKLYSYTLFVSIFAT